MSLSDGLFDELVALDAPLAARMRPLSLDELVGQEAILGPGTPLREAIERDQAGSMIFWGPPGCGKSTLARLIARTTKAAFETQNAVESGVGELRKVMERARQRRRMGQRTVLFVDEIHRWNKVQQDTLLASVEDGTVALIGATTENPHFEVNAPLLSRARLYRLQPLDDAAVRALLERALATPGRGLGDQPLTLAEDALAHLVAVAGGDARRALNALEAAAQAALRADGHITLAMAEEGAQVRALAYDRQDDEHYNTISAFIRSIRGSDPDAGVYWLAKMLAAGEDVNFIARRLVILASEDIGNADPMALVVATAAAEAVRFVGLPEGQLNLAQAVTYLACAPKSNASSMAIWTAADHISKHGAGAVPEHLCDKNSVRGRYRGEGKEYRYVHDYPSNWIAQRYLPEGVEERFYRPGDQGREAKIAERLARLRGEDSDTIRE